MKLHAYRKNEFFKCETPINTLKRLEEAFLRLGIDIEHEEGRISRRGGIIALGKEKKQ